MNLLNACLALMLTLGVFASVVTVLVEMIYQAIQQRARDLQGMLGYVFDAVFAGEKALQKLDVAGLREDFTGKLRSDRVLDALVRKHGTVLKWIAGRWAANDTAMTLETFLRRLDRSAVYREYLEVLSPEGREKTLKALADEFGRAERAISELFRVRAKLVSYLVGVGLAVTVNVDAVRLFEYFTANPVATEAAIARLQEMAGEAQAKPEAPPLTAAQRQDADAMLLRLRKSQAMGLPVGWAYYPYCLPQPGAGRLDPQCPPAQPTASAADAMPQEAARSLLENIHSAGRPLFWLLSVIVTGFLIGLGGPYWFDLAMSLSRFRDFLKTGQPSPATQTPPPDPEALVAAFLEKMNQSPVSSQGEKS